MTTWLCVTQARARLGKSRHANLSIYNVLVNACKLKTSDSQYLLRMPPALEAARYIWGVVEGRGLLLLKSSVDFLSLIS